MSSGGRGLGWVKSRYCIHGALLSAGGARRRVRRARKKTAFVTVLQRSLTASHSVCAELATHVLADMSWPTRVETGRPRCPLPLLPCRARMLVLRLVAPAASEADASMADAYSRRSATLNDRAADFICRYTRNWPREASRFKATRLNRRSSASDDV